MTNLRIREIRWLEKDVCTVVFAVYGLADNIETVARLRRVRDVVVVTYDDNVMAHYR